MAVRVILSIGLPFGVSLLAHIGPFGVSLLALFGSLGATRLMLSLSVGPLGLPMFPRVGRAWVLSVVCACRCWRVPERSVERVCWVCDRCADL